MIMLLVKILYSLIAFMCFHPHTHTNYWIFFSSSSSNIISIINYQNPPFLIFLLFFSLYICFMLQKKSSMTQKKLYFLWLVKFFVVVSAAIIKYLTSLSDFCFVGMLFYCEIIQKLMMMMKSAGCIICEASESFWASSSSSHNWKAIKNKYSTIVNQLYSFFLLSSL